MTRSPASIYNPHQAVWDEGYAAGLAAGVANILDEADKPPLGDVEYAKQWASDTLSGRATGGRFAWGDRNLSRTFLDILRARATNALPLLTAPASGEGADAPINTDSLVKRIKSSLYVAHLEDDIIAALVACDAQIAMLQTERDDALRAAADRESARLELSERFKEHS